MTGPDTRWVAFIRGEDRTGTLTALASVFSSRGVNFESIATGDLHHASGLIVLIFTASDRVQHLLARTVARLAAIREIRVCRADDPAVRAVGVVDGLDGPVVGPAAERAVRWSNLGGPGPVFVEGALVSVEQALGRTHAAGASTLAVVVLPPQADRD